MLNAFTVDVEEWFCSHNLRHAIPFDRWPDQEVRVLHNTRRILQLLKDHQTEATFFILGWVAQRVPELVQEIEEAGHEIASHGYDHIHLGFKNPDGLRRDLENFFSVVSPLVKEKIRGYRAPTFSITSQTMWAVDVLKEFDFEYDSSVFPVGGHPDYGIAASSLGMYDHPNRLLEIPMSCAEVAFKKIPCSGGGYFRLYPYRLFKTLFKRCNTEGRTGIFYIHPWEIDEQSPRISLPFPQRFRHYQNIDKTMLRLERLLGDFRFTSIRNLLKSSDHF